MFICFCDDQQLYYVVICGGHTFHTPVIGRIEEYSYDTIVTLKEIEHYNSLDWLTENL